MRQKIEVQMSDGQIIVYYSGHQKNEAILAEIHNLFPQAKAWRRVGESSRSEQTHSALYTATTVTPSSKSRQFLRGGIALAICAALFVYGDDVYREIRYQVFMYQLRQIVLGEVPVGTSSSRTAIDTASNRPNNIKILSTSDQRAGSDSRTVIGEVQNIGNSTYEYVDVQVTFYNNVGTVVDTHHTYVEPSTLNPGEKASFKVWIDNDRNFVRYTVTVLD